jgi:hypothetical protein
MGFELFDKRKAPLAKLPSVTIQRRGLFSLNRAAYKLMGEPTQVELLYDRDAMKIAIRAAHENSPHAYPVRSQSKKENGPLMIAGTAFTAFYNIDTDVSRRWVPIFEDGMLQIDLTGASAEIVGNRSALKATAGAGESETTADGDEEAD